MNCKAILDWKMRGQKPMKKRGDIELSFGTSKEKSEQFRRIVREIWQGRDWIDRETIAKILQREVV